MTDFPVYTGAMTAQEPGGKLPSFSQPTVKPAWVNSGITQNADNHDYIVMEDTPLKAEDRGFHDHEAWWTRQYKLNIFRQ